MLLDVRGLSSGYGKVTVLHEVDLAIDAGEIVAMLGPNGAGKSTMMKTIAGHLVPTEGRITVDGVEVSGHPARAVARSGIGYVPQEHNVFRDLSVRDNLRVAAPETGTAANRVAQVFEHFPILAERATQRAETLSGGERQALAICSALLADPKVLLLDEPTAGLAPLFVGRVVEWISELAAAGMGVVWVVEQNPDEILAVSSRTYFVEGGRTTELDSAALLEPGRLQDLLLEKREVADEPSSATEQR